MSNVVAPLIFILSAASCRLLPLAALADIETSEICVISSPDTTAFSTAVASRVSTSSSREAMLAVAPVMACVLTRILLSLIMIEARVVRSDSRNRLSTGKPSRLSLLVIVSVATETE